MRIVAREHRYTSPLSPPDAAKSETDATTEAILRGDTGATEVQEVCMRSGGGRTRPVVAGRTLKVQRATRVMVVASVDKIKRRLPLTPPVPHSERQNRTRGNENLMGLHMLNM